MIMPTPLPPAGTLPLAAQSVSEIRVAVRRFIGSRVNDTATADDLTQEVLLKVHQRLPQVRDPRRLMGWVIQIARNTIIDFFRTHRNSEAYVEEVHAGDTPSAPPLPAEENRLRDDLNVYIRSVVQDLPPIYRDALVLTEFDGLTQVELAERLGLSVSAAKSRVQRARAMVHQTIDRCCHFEVDRYGTVLDYSPRQPTCKCPTPLGSQSKQDPSGSAMKRSR
jgi:RNA polymerase sigma-70 factor (ECF subfamily)